MSPAVTLPPRVVRRKMLVTAFVTVEPRPIVLDLAENLNSRVGGPQGGNVIWFPPDVNQCLTAIITRVWISIRGPILPKAIMRGPKDVVPGHRLCFGLVRQVGDVKPVLEYSRIRCVL